MKDLDVSKLIDLYLDDELPLELVLEFKQEMFANADLSAEVSSLREAQEQLKLAYEGDQMTDEENSRVFGRIVAETAAFRLQPEAAMQLGLPLLQNQYKLPINEV